MTRAHASPECGILLDICILSGRAEAMAAVAPPASALLQALIQYTATEEDLRRVDEHPEVLLDAPPLSSPPSAPTAPR